MIFPAAFSLLGLGCLVVFIYYRIKECSVESMFIKAVASFFFLASAASSVVKYNDGTNRLVFGMFVLCGLFFGLLGDIWLELKYVHRNSDVAYTYAGFTVFAIGHIFYIGALIMKYYTAGSQAYIVVPLLAAFAFTMIAVFGEDMLRVKYGRFKPVVAVYSFILISFCLISLSFAVKYKLKSPTLNLINIGSVFFLISDIVLNGIYFGTDKNTPVRLAVNYSTYYLAQFIIAFSLCLLN